MSPFRSLKNNITNSFSSVRAVEGLEPANDLRIGDTNAHETWTYAGRRYYAFTESGYFDVTVSGKADIAIIGGGGSVVVEEITLHVEAVEVLAHLLSIMMLLFPLEIILLLLVMVV